MKQIIVDVREKDEFDAEHVADAIHLPLSTFGRQAPGILKAIQGQSVTLMCYSGKRATLASAQAAKFCPELKLEVFSGGIQEWKKQGKPTVTVRASHLPVMRQVQLVAGLLILLGASLAYFVNPAFIFLSGFVGAGLTVAGVTGFCGMAEILSRLPWNR